MNQFDGSYLPLLEVGTPANRWLWFTIMIISRYFLLPIIFLVIHYFFYPLISMLLLLFRIRIPELVFLNSYYVGTLFKY